jgi:hypothetical protein
MSSFVRGMLVLGLLALLAALVLLWRPEDRVGSAPQTTPSIGERKPVGTSTLSHGGPASTANQSDTRDPPSQR